MELNKKVIILILSVVVLLIFVWIIFWLIPALKLGTTQNNVSETLLESSVSPDGKYTLEAYKTEPGATVDFSIKVYIITKTDKSLIYNVYHEYKVDIDWISDNQVSINSRTLDLSKNETYDWRNN